ncbi:MAG: sigma-54-dependent Fis family transcriptional regulator [Bacteroidetes bacterium]|nr:sigma-54-dependent Fis family transcriptional regulator [Bacteroidota bacterium]
MRILIVDDEASQREVLYGYLKKKKFTVQHASSSDEAAAAVRSHHFDLVLTDFKMPGKTGFDLLQEVKRIDPETVVVLMTAFGTIEGAVDAMRAGAYDYLSKPIELDEIDLLVRRVQERSSLIEENRNLRDQLREKLSFTEIVSQSSAMQDVLSTASRVASAKAPVLVRGESGTGKELIARAIHFNSPRSTAPFIAVNCAALNDNLLESELFGHEKGAFTGAEKQRRGRFELADGGTIFLDEIGDISPATQVRLLRVLQEQKFERVGGSETIAVDVRIVAATNKNLESAIASGKFRDDLYYRLNVVTIEIPPLRSRREDISVLLEHFLNRFAKEHKRKKLAFSKEAWESLIRYDYPGNVRELENIVQRSVIFSRGEQITSADIPLVVRGSSHESSSRKPVDSTFDEQIEQLEKELIFEALRLNGNNQSKAAQHLKLSERNLRYRLKKWGVK